MLPAQPFVLWESPYLIPFFIHLMQNGSNDLAFILEVIVKIAGTHGCCSRDVVGRYLADPLLVK